MKDIRKNTAILICGFLLMVNCQAAVSNQGRINRVSLSSKSFDVSKNESVSVSFEITAVGDVNVCIYDVLAREIRCYAMPKLKSGRHSIAWDGKNSSGDLAAGDIFLYIIKATWQNGQTSVYNPADKTGGFEIKAAKFSLDREKQIIEYVLPKAAMVRIRAGLNSGFFAGAVVDWTPQTAGRHQYKWDGKDASGLLNLIKNPGLDLRLSCYSLPDNCIVVSGNPKEIETNETLTESQNLFRNKIWATEGKYLHYCHDRRFCHSPGFKVSFINGRKTDDETSVVISKVAPVRIEIDKRDKKHLTDTKFEVMFYVDGVFLYEMEEGSSPFTYDWDVRNFNRGVHILTVNILAYDDHIGSQSYKVIIGD